MIGGKLSGEIAGRLDDNGESPVCRPNPGSVDSRPKDEWGTIVELEGFMTAVFECTSLLRKDREAPPATKVNRPAPMITASVLR